MTPHTRQDEIALYQMYLFSGTRAIAQFPDADGITILRTAKGNEYCFPISMDHPFVPEVVPTLVDAEDPQVLYLIHVWKSHWPDVPPFDLRQSLSNLHPQNKYARMLLAGGEDFIIRSLEDTMPAKAT